MSGCEDVLYINTDVLIQLPGTAPVKSHILCNGRHCASITMMHTRQKVRSREIVALQRRSKVFSAAVTICQ